MLFLILLVTVAVIFFVPAGVILAYLVLGVRRWRTGRQEADERKIASGKNTTVRSFFGLFLLAVAFYTVIYFLCSWEL